LKDKKKKICKLKEMEIEKKRIDENGKEEH
jgi:hypothetical protein